MIHITDKSQCCGCTVCVSVCPKRCIRMIEDDEGFLYPEVDGAACINCGVCEQVCPELCSADARTPVLVYAAKNRNEEIRMASSSGGIFTLLAEKIIDCGGVVFGARFDVNWDVVHDYAETREGLVAFRGSKYVQSRMGDCYQKAKSFLLQGRKVMFTGTPCQIAGLKNFLRKDYDNLFTVDVVCHGVPSPKVWQIYLNEIASQGEKNSVLSHHNGGKMRIENVDFRSKSSGWKKYSFALTLSEATADGEKNTVLRSTNFYKNPYMNAFLLDLSLRLSCYNCPAKGGKSGSDLTIADFWGINEILPNFDDDKGISLVLVYSEKGQQWLEDLNCEYETTDFQSCLKKNKAILYSCKKPVNRSFFFRQLKKNESVIQAYDDCSSAALNKRVRRFMYRKLGI